MRRRPAREQLDRTDHGAVPYKAAKQRVLLFISLDLGPWGQQEADRARLCEQTDKTHVPVGATAHRASSINDWFGANSLDNAPFR